MSEKSGHLGEFQLEKAGQLGELCQKMLANWVKYVQKKTDFLVWYVRKNALLGKVLLKKLARRENPLRHEAVNQQNGGAFFPPMRVVPTRRELLHKKAFSVDKTCLRGMKYNAALANTYIPNQLQYFLSQKQVYMRTQKANTCIQENYPPTFITHQ